MLRVHADEIVSHPQSTVIPISQNKTFEELLLDQVNQMPHVKTERKRICGGAVVITSGEVIKRMTETVSKNVKDRNRKKRKTKRKTKKSYQEKRREW
jgi:hypothetical protein